MRGSVTVLALACMAAFSTPAPTHAQSLKGSKKSLDLQNQVATQHDFTFINTTSQAKRFVELGYLVHVKSNGDYRVNRISHPYARPEVELFVSRLGRQYRNACGEQLVITSLTRPTNRQPRNASARSVHPTGMAMDIRRSSSRVAVAYRVRNGDSLWSIARKHGTSITELRTANELRGSRIYAGQVLTVPAGR